MRTDTVREESYKSHTGVRQELEHTVNRAKKKFATLVFLLSV